SGIDEVHTSMQRNEQDRPVPADRPPERDRRVSMGDDEAREHERASGHLRPGWCASAAASVRRTASERRRVRLHTVRLLADPGVSEVPRPAALEECEGEVRTRTALPPCM